MYGRIDQVVRAAVLLMAMFSFQVLAEETVNDPLEAYNRVIFSFNDKADRLLLKPVAQSYRALTPDPIEHGISRMFGNLEEILNVTNNILQGKFRQAANDGGRFLLNSTLGLAGFFEVAASMGLEKSDGEDFGQTLGRWGVGSGPYVVIPFLGSSTLRDAPSMMVDSFFNPISEVDHIPTRNTLYGFDLLVLRSELLDAEELVSGDRYTFLRDVYLQRRAYLVEDGAFVDSFGDDFGDSEDYYDY